MKIFTFTLVMMALSLFATGQPLTNQKNITMTSDNTHSDTSFTSTELDFLAHCLKLAEEALIAGDKPLGSILVNDKNQVIAEARNRVNEKNELAHPEIELAEWAMENLSL